MLILSGEKYFHYRLQFISANILIKYIVQHIASDGKAHKEKRPHEQGSGKITDKSNNSAQNLEFGNIQCRSYNKFVFIFGELRDY